ncbi:phenylacetaldehyde synthase-like [Mercurialis annua]|uniref:phenylacetaldehyde synthase-like n=1 Tax=Mercurialis annua TaxID=3986 RepID=UPI0024AD112F|nr:phenylacetaldehyde synthase-like [Mercurialis annua]
MGSLPTDTFCSLDTNTFSDESKIMIDFITEYYNNIEKYPVQSQVQPGFLSTKLPKSAPISPEPLELILKDISDKIISGLTHWQSPSFFGYFQANASNAGFLGEMLCSGLNIVGFNWVSSPAATELESVVMDWMGKLLKLPSSFLFSGNGGGVLHGSTCEAIVCSLAAARDRALQIFGSDKITKLVVYASDQTHSTLYKGTRLVGIPPSNIRSLPTSVSSEFSLSPEILQDAIDADMKLGFIPLYLCATVGTTGCGAVDPIYELGKIAKRHSLWFHIDAAYAGGACICPEFRHYLNGVEFADSISMNPHKWLLTNMDCCCFWVKQPNLLVESLSCEAEFLKNEASESKTVVDYKDWQISLSRRFKALKLWIVIRRHGLVNLMYHIRSDVSLAKRFESLVRNDDRFEIVVPTKFALVCFRLKPNRNGTKTNELNCRFLDAVNQSGHAFMTHGVAGGAYFIRCAVGSTLTEERHVDDLWKLIQEKADFVLN